MTRENAAAMNRMMTMTSVSCSPIIFQTLFAFACRRLFFPYTSRRFAASASDKPSSLVFKTRIVSSLESECQGFRLGVSMMVG